LFPLSITLLFREFPPHERGMAMGTFGIPALLAPALGPTLGGYLVTYAGWQSIFYINLPVGILAVILVSIFIREAPVHVGLRFDVVGFVLAALGLAMVLYGLSDASTDGWGSTKILGFLIGGALVLVLFVIAELLIASREGQPLLDLRLFRNGPFRTSIIASLFVIFSLFGGVFLLPIYLQTLRGQSAFQAGLILLPQALASMVSVLVGGRLVDRIGVRAVMIPGLILLGIATWQLSFITVYSPYWWVQTMLIIRGLGLGLCIQPLTVAGLSEISPRQLAQASSLNTVARSVSSSLGIAVLATLVQTRAQVHFGHLAEQVTATSPLGQMVAVLQAAYVAQGAGIIQAHTAAIQIIAGLLQRQAFVLALQDAFDFSLVVVVLAIIAVLFVRQTRRQARVPQVAPGQDERAEELDASRLVLVE
jgi:DHA2 family multidrug resistance protein